MSTEPGSRVIFEDEYKVGKFRRILEPGGGRKRRLMQFYDDDTAPKMGVTQGRLHTVAVDDIVEVK